MVWLTMNIWTNAAARYVVSTQNNDDLMRAVVMIVIVRHGEQERNNTIITMFIINTTMMQRHCRHQQCHQHDHNNLHMRIKRTYHMFNSDLTDEGELLQRYHNAVSAQHTTVQLHQQVQCILWHWRTAAMYLWDEQQPLVRHTACNNLCLIAEKLTCWLRSSNKCDDTLAHVADTALFTIAGISLLQLGDVEKVLLS